MSDDQTPVGPQPATPSGRKPGSVRGAALLLLLLPTLCLVGGAAWWLHNPGEGGPPATSPDLPSTTEHDDLFFGWPKPDFALVLSAQQHGYLMPCGCSEPQFGGLERRYNFIESLRKERGWPVLAYDLGDVPQKQGPAKLANVQGLIKYRYAMEAMKRMGYVAVSFGEYEAALPLNDALDEYALNNNQPAVLAANLVNKAGQFPDKDRKGADWGKSYVASWNVAKAANGTRVGALGIISAHTPADVAALVAKGTLPQGLDVPPSVGGQITALDPKFKFAKDDVPGTLEAMAAEKPEFRVLLYQGPIELARLLPKFFPKQFQVILCLSVEDEPPGVPTVVDDTFIIRLGHKGKNIGVVGVKRTGNAARPFDMRYQLVSMSPKYKTPEGKEGDNPVLGLLEKYKKELKADDYLAKYGKIPHRVQAEVKRMPQFATASAGYIGSEACKKCHATAFKIWRGSDHAHAYHTLAKPTTKPAPAEFDPECVVCHTIGFRYDGGFANMTKTPILKDVGCESCHGPCEIHKKNPNDKAIRALINPWKAPRGETPDQKAKRQLRIEGMCRECHDAENDVNWKAFLPKWTKVEHMTPADERQGGDDD